MGMFDPKTGGVTLQDLFQEGQPFILLGAKIVATGNKQYGDDRMVVLTVKTGVDSEEQASVWGKYLLAQVEAMEPSDLPKEVKLVRQQVDGFGQNPVKMLIPTDDSDIPY